MTYPDPPPQDRPAHDDGLRPSPGGAWPQQWGSAPPADAGAAHTVPPGAAPYASAPYASAPYASAPAAYPAHVAAPTVPAPVYPEQTPDAPESGAPASRAKPGRDRYLDLLRAVALVRVVVFHLFGWAWLTVLFPSMGVMFALAGSLMARSLARPAGSVIRSRLRRLLPPMWAFSLVVVPAMFALSWKPVREEGLWWFIKIGSYLFPIGSPPYPEESGSAGGWLELTWADQAAGPLWYIRAYLWFVIASPLLLKAFRRLPWVTLLAPVALTAVIGTGLVTVPGTFGEGLVDFAVFGSCWILGFAHNDGLLKEIPRYLAVSSAAIVMGFGLWWASGHLTEEGWNLDEIPLAQATWSLGFCAILLVYAPSWKKLPGRLAGWDSLVTLANNRAVTIYLWHNLLLMAAAHLVNELWSVPWFGDTFSTYIEQSFEVLVLIVIWPLIGLAILAFGWVEDVAAKRRPRLWPNGADRTRRA
ncbi:acyltransferase family protein [Streptomyces atroolivaceus]|uniref:Acyltransferase n=1 Tax=Streptomyces atroolivaceus TaxID=66869 RepID=A0ABV9V7N7_STRAZ|nr:acyltransferase [Streptomyces atroolivaceus]